MGGIRDSSISESADISVGKIGFPSFLSGKHTDGSLPKVVWVAKGGADSAGATGVSHVGSRSEPFLTIWGANGAQRYTVDGRGDRIILGPGTWRENGDFGSGTGTTGTAGRMNKRDIGIFGSGGAHPGRTQIVGDGTTTGPTIRVRDGYLRGFILADLEVGSVDSADADRALPLLDLETVDDAATLTATSSDEWWVLRNVRLDGGGTATHGLVISGAQQGRTYGLEIANCTLGIALRGSGTNVPENDHFYDTLFHDNVTADVCTLMLSTTGAWSTTIGANQLTNVTFHGNRYMDRGGTPVTNFVNIPNGAAAVNCGDYDFFAARDVADGTLMEVPANWIAIGQDPSSAVFFIGA